MPRPSRLLLLAAALALALPGARAGAQGSVCASCDSAQRAELARTLEGQLSKVRAELASLAPQLERLTAELAAGQPMTEARLQLVLRENELRGYHDQLERALARLGLQERRARVVPRVERPRQVGARAARAPSPRREPSASAGYIGVSFSGAIEPMPGARSFFFHDYPQVVSVDAGSPAERGGLQAGDVLVMLGDTELRGKGVDLESVLRPGRRIPVRFRRAGALRSTTLVVAKRPAAVRADPAAPVVVVPGESGPATIVFVTPPAAPAPGAAPTPAVAPLPPTFISGGMTGGVAGAEVARVQGNLREVLGVDGGLLVLDVGMETPAARAGLRPGDVILRAGGRAMRAPVDLMRAVQSAKGSSLRLDVVRKKERMAVDLRW